MALQKRTVLNGQGSGYEDTFSYLMTNTSEQNITSYDFNKFISLSINETSFTVESRNDTGANDWKGLNNPNEIYNYITFGSQD